jgi:hypothetical protein
MPDTFGKRQRQGVRARKAAAKEERRIARNRRREARAAGALDTPGEDAWLGTANPSGGEDQPSADSVD